MAEYTQILPTKLACDRPAIAGGERALTWTQLEEICAAMAGSFDGVVPLQPVGLRFDDAVDLVAAAFAAVSCGHPLVRSGAPVLTELPPPKSGGKSRVPPVSDEFESFLENSIRPRQFGGAWSLEPSDSVALEMPPDVGTPLLDALQACSAGASVHLLPPAPLAPRKLARSLSESRATVLHIGAESLLQVTREFPWGLESVRRIICDAREAKEASLDELPSGVRLKTILRYADFELGGGWALRFPRCENWGPLYFAAQVSIELSPDDVYGEIHARLRRGGLSLFRTGVQARRVGGDIEVGHAAFDLCEPAGASPVERDLVEIWRAVLGGGSFTIDDNFFDAGGKSMDLVKVASLVQQRLGRKIGLLMLFSNPTIRTLSAALDSGRP